MSPSEYFTMLLKAVEPKNLPTQEQLRTLAVTVHLLDKIKSEEFANVPWDQRTF